MTKNKTNKRRKECRASTKKASSGSSDNKFHQLLAAAVVATAAYFWSIGDSSRGHDYWDSPQAFQKRTKFQRSNASTVEERLLQEWPAGGMVTIDDSSRLRATQNIVKGQIVTAVQYEDLAKSVAQEHPGLKEMVQKSLAKQQATMRSTTMTFSKILSVIGLLLEVEQGDDSPWSSYIESLPRNISTMAWYWTPEERVCVVPRPDGDTIHQELHLFHAVMDDIQQQFEPLHNIYNPQTTEWAFLNLKTRGFGHFYMPVLNVAQHNPLKAVPVFLSPSAAYIVAAENIQPGDSVYLSFGTLSPVVLAERYGVLEDSQIASTYFEIPSILEAFRTAERTRNEPLCTQEPAIFFGNVTKQQLVTATFNEKQTHATYFKPYMPDERTYACLRVLLQTERDTDVAYHVVSKLQVDLQRYEEMAQAPHCQPNTGNFPLIRQANDLTAQLMRGALKVAELGRDWKISYPGIDSYIRNGS